MAHTNRHIYTGHTIELDIERVTLPNGHCFDLEVVRHPGGAAVVALDAEERICLLRQYRHVAGGWLWEIPAGKLDPRELPAQTAARELREEAGLEAGQWLDLGTILTSPGVFTERIHLYLARDLTPGQSATEDHEAIEIHWVTLATTARWALDGTIADAKSVVGLLRARAALDRAPSCPPTDPRPDRPHGPAAPLPGPGGAESIKDTPPAAGHPA